MLRDRHHGVGQSGPRIAIDGGELHRLQHHPQVIGAHCREETLRTAHPKRDHSDREDEDGDGGHDLMHSADRKEPHQRHDHQCARGDGNGQEQRQM